MLSCCINGCQYIADVNSPQSSHFYRFPTDKDTYKCWVAAVRRPNFVPNESSRVCTRHFDSTSFFKVSGFLKKNSVPTINLGMYQENPALDRSIEDPLTCILGQSNALNQVAVRRGSTDENLPQCLDSVKITNPTHNSNGSISVQKPTTPLPASNLSNCAIKLVDMKKLLEHPPDEKEETKPSTSLNPMQFNLSKTNIENSSKSPPAWKRPLISDANTLNTAEVLDCLKKILPLSFTLSRLKLSEKVVALIIKCLNLKKTKYLEKFVTEHLNLIIEAAKSKEKVFGNFTSHPYHNINKETLAHTLIRIFPDNFSITDVSNEKLKCFCVLISQEVFTDGFPILRRKIQKWALEGSSNVVATLSIDDNSSDEDVVEVEMPNKRKKLDVTLKEKPNENSKLNIHTTPTPLHHSNNKHRTNSKPDVSMVVKNVISENKNPNKPLNKQHVSNSKPDVTLVVKTEIPSQANSVTTEDKKAKIAKNLKLVMNFLAWEKYSATDVLNNHSAMKDLCKFLQIRRRQSNLQRLKKMLLFILDNNLNNTKILDSKIKAKQQLKKKSQQVVSEQKLEIKSESLVDTSHVQETSASHIDEKLMSIPNVSLCDIAAFSIDQLILQGDKLIKAEKHISAKTSVPIKRRKEYPYFMLHKPLRKFSSDYVRKVTFESFQEFRKIIMKRDGEKVVFRLQYKKLAPGSLVFVKNFKYLSLGWFKGTITGTDGPLRYFVQLDNFNTWSCVCDQIRPLPEKMVKESLIKGTYSTVGIAEDELLLEPKQEDGWKRSSRTQRNIKPKQMLDL